VGAVGAYVWTYAFPTPIGATIPSFAVTFALYLLLSIGSRAKQPKMESRHLADAAAEPASHA
jgi:hypothetical protein